MKGPGQRYLTLGWAVLGYLVLTVLLTWPTAANFSRAVAGFKGLDSLQYTWSLWWSRQAWGHLGHSPAHVTLLYHPWGGEHGLLAVTPLLDWLALPLHTLFNPTEVYNLLFLGSFVLTGATTYLLVVELTGKPLAAFFAGIIFAFFPNRMGHALSGHLTQMAAWWFPLYLRYLLQTLDRPGRRSALLAGLFLALSLEIALVQTAYFVAPATALVLAYGLIIQRRRLNRRHLWAGCLLFGLAALSVLPTYGPFLWNARQQSIALAAPGVVEHSVDILALLLPPPHHPLWGHIVGQIEALHQLFPEPNELEHTAFLGWIPLLLSVRAIVRREKIARLWLTVGLASLWLSLGPVLRIGGRITTIPQPYAVLMRFPLYRWGRTPERFNELTMLSVSLLAAQGLAGLRWSQPVKATLIGFTLMEMMVLWPFPAGTPNPPAALAAWETEPGAVLNLPISKRQIGNLAMYHQTTHRQPIVGGYIHRDLPGMRSYVKAVDAALTAQAQTAERPLTSAELRGWLDGLDIRHVVLHRQFVTTEWVKDVSTRLREAIGPPATDTGSELIFDVPSQASSTIPLALFGDTIALLDAQVEPAVSSAGQSITVTLRWQALSRPDDRYTVFVHLVDDSETRVAQHDGESLGGNWPTSLWASHQILVDQHPLQLPTTVPAGRYHLSVGFYRPESGNRLPVRTATGDIPDSSAWSLPDALEVVAE
jgi:hypothetical protein